jgi:hypothetical protein
MLIAAVEKTVALGHPTRSLVVRQVVRKYARKVTGSVHFYPLNVWDLVLHTHTHTHTQVPCSTASEALERHKRAARMRQQACTGVNSTSSRSHCIFAVSDTQQRFLKRLFGLVLTVNFGGLECVKV